MNESYTQYWDRIAQTINDVQQFDELIAEQFKLMCSLDRLKVKNTKFISIGVPSIKASPFFTNLARTASIFA